MRSEVALKNTQSAFGVYILMIGMQFFVRLAFVRNLSFVYLGVHSLFTYIVATLSLAELGIGTAAMYSLYKPLVHRDGATIRAIMHFLKKAYYFIGMGVMVLGCLLMPGLDFFLHGRPALPYMEVIYFLFVLDTGVGYFLSYKRNLLLADQRQFISNYYQGVCQIFLGLAQIIVLFCLQNYILFIILKLGETVTENYLISRKVDQIYQEWQHAPIKVLDSAILKEIRRNVQAVFLHRFGGIVSRNLSGLLVAHCLGVMMVGLYSNYYLVISTLQGIAGQIMQALTATIGQFAVGHSNEEQTEIFWRVEFLVAWGTFYASIGLYIFLNPFIELWLGTAYLLQDGIVLLFVVNFYVLCMRQPVILFESALGLLWYDRYKPLMMAAISIGLGLYWGNIFQISGILAAALVASLLTCFWIEPYVLMHYGIYQPIHLYFQQFLRYSGVTVGVGSLLKFLYGWWGMGQGILAFILALILYTLVANLIWSGIFYRTALFKYAWGNVIGSFFNSFYGGGTKGGSH